MWQNDGIDLHGLIVAALLTQAVPGVKYRYSIGSFLPRQTTLYFCSYVLSCIVFRFICIFSCNSYQVLTLKKKIPDNAVFLKKLLYIVSIYHALLLYALKT